MTRLELSVLALCWACTSAVPSQKRVASQNPPVEARADTLTPADRAEIIEVVASFREAIFLGDTTPVDGCSVAAILGVGPEYRDLIHPTFRSRITDSSAGCNSRRERGIRLVLRAITDNGPEVTVDAEYAGGSYVHSEVYKIRKPTRVGGAWVPIEVRAYGLVIFD
ncbi:MAG: hypothetical protein QOK07_1903 [Gemmatimonadaceae bacterium]|jgi:hypothetical protein|nr:hypothetical protein [Gemmatimonadaceae bacterium]